MRENESFDDYIYWDSINNHIEPDKKSNAKNSLKVSKKGKLHLFINFSILSVVKLQSRSNFEHMKSKSKNKFWHNLSKAWAWHRILHKIVKTYHLLFVNAFKEYSISNGSALKSQISFWLIMSIFALQVKRKLHENSSA